MTETVRMLEHKGGHLRNLNKQEQSTGEHEVHSSECKFLPSAENRQYLGYFSSSKEAIIEAKKYYANVDGCWYCCREIHTK